MSIFSTPYGLRPCLLFQRLLCLLQCARPLLLLGHNFRLGFELRLRSLLVRGRAEVRGRTKDSRRLERIARLPNGACWHVLSFWRDAG